MALYLAPTVAVFVIAFIISAGVTLSEVGSCWRRHVAHIFLWGAGFGVLGFLAGFVLPATFSASPQGPLLGIFLTGPAGAAAGCVLGAVKSARRIERSEKKT